MKTEELREIIRHIAECDAYLNTNKVSPNILKLIEAASQRVVLERRSNLYDRLRDAGLRIEEEV